MSLRILRIAAGTTFQDRGRPGYRRYGVPPGGAFDRESYELARALVGRRGGAVIEIPMLGGEFEALESDYISITGASCRVELDGRDLRSDCAIPIEPGDRIKLFPTDHGARAYMASSRGWEAAATLGSSSGQAPPDILISLRDALPANLFIRKLGSNPDSLFNRSLRFVPVPQARTSDLDQLRRRDFQVSLHSNRIGIRLEGGFFEPREELPSEPSCFGVIQLAPSGELLIHGPDGPTIGGYPKVGVVTDADLDRLGQLRPGDEVSFSQVSFDVARQLSRERALRLIKTLSEIQIASSSWPA